MSPRILIVTHPGLGHLRPLLPVARALRDRGATVAFAVADGFRSVVAREGFASMAAGLDWNEAHAERTFPEMHRLPVGQRGMFLLRHIFADAVAHATARALLDLIPVWRPDLIVGTDYEFGAAVAGEAAGIPVVTISVALPLEPHDRTRLIGDEIAYLRSAFGLDPCPPVHDPANLYLTYAPPSIVADRAGLSRMRPPYDVGAADIPRDILELPQRPTVYASLGTVFGRTDVFAAIIAGLRDLDVNIIAAVGPHVDPDSFGPQPKTVVIARHLPQEALLGRADLFITHCPFYTALCGLLEGVPLLMVPLSGDQPAHALRFAALRAGLVLRAHEIPEAAFPDTTERLTARSVAGASEILLRDPAYRDRARQFSAEIRQLPDISAAADTVCAHIGSRHG